MVHICQQLTHGCRIFRPYCFSQNIRCHDNLITLAAVSARFESRRSRGFSENELFLHLLALICPQLYFCSSSWVGSALQLTVCRGRTLGCAREGNSAPRKKKKKSQIRLFMLEFPNAGNFPISVFFFVE